MSPRLPTSSAKEVIRALERGGFKNSHQKGSHVYFWNSEKNLLTSVPMHSGDLGRGLLKAIIKQAGFSEEEFRKLL